MGILDVPGVTFSAADARYGIRANRNIEGLPVIGYGNSYLAFTGNAYRSYFDRVKARLGHSASTVPYQGWFNAGIGGILAGDISNFAFGSWTRGIQGVQLLTQISVGSAGTSGGSGLKGGGFYILEMLRNDAGCDGQTMSGGTTAKSRAGAANGLESMIRLSRAISRIEDSDSNITYSGTWTTSSANVFSGGAVKATTVQGSSASRTITVPAGGEIDVLLLGLDDVNYGNTGATYSVSCTGQTTVTGTTSNQFRKTQVNGAAVNGPGNTFGHMVVPFTGLTPGNSVTVTVTKTDANGSQLCFDGFLLTSGAPCTCLVMKVPYVGAAGYATYNSTGGNASQAVDDIYNNIINTVVAKFPNDKSVVAIDVNALGFNPATMIGNYDGASLHLNDFGNATYADYIMTTLNALPLRNGLQWMG